MTESVRFILAFHILYGLLHATPVAAQVRPFNNEVGWVWQVEPIPATNGAVAKSGLVLMLSELKDGDVLLTIAFSEDPNQDAFAFRGVAFDNLNRRYEFDRPVGGGSDGVSLQAFRMPAERLTWDKLKRFGIEKLTNDSLRMVISPKAVQKLKDQGEQALKYPEIGKPYIFQIKAVDGSILRSKDFLGKVVLLDFWASWCTPCMAKMPKLKETYRQLSDRGFEVIGINHDNTVESANRVLSKENLPWREVLAPMGKDERALWNVGAGITSLPRLWLIDRNGILRADVSVQELDEAIQKLVDE
jgi:thiol-disulfide isomerase/thioredoxin